MHMKRLVQIFLVAVLAYTMPVQAGSMYFCDFESQAARDRWVLNPVANQNIYNQLANKWYIDEPGNNSSTGHYGLYVSDDNGASVHYRNKGCWIFAYDTISLPAMSGDYLLTFDYCVMANVASKVDGLYALWIPMVDPDTGDSINLNCVPTGGIPAKYANYIIRLQPQAGMNNLNGTVTWKQCAVNIKGADCDGTPHYLAFAWQNGSNIAQQPAASVDNILITDGEECPQPTNLTVTANGTTVTLNWQGTADEYEVSAYSYDGQKWLGPRLTGGLTTANFTSVPIGQTDFIVRAKCGDGFYSLKTIVSKLIYYPDQLCVDYLNINNAKCYIDNSSPNNTLTFNDFKQVQPVDNGPSSSASRHVVHFDRTEYEPRTGGQAKTVPDGELASVRLGNWEADNHAERIEFSFAVDTIKYPVLLLKYMPLLEAPGHDDHENPRFKLDILINGQTIGECGQADFNANNVMNGTTLKPEAVQQGWHLTPSSVSQTSADIVWKDWTTVGVNLRDKNYAGKTLTARLTTHDCTFSAHCGYAYFTLGCSDGKLKGMKCGAINPEFEAPDGFHYRWAYAYNEKYRRPDGSLPDQYILSTDQHYTAGMHDDSLYVVDCMFVQDHSCYFSLYASTLATNPIPVVRKPKIYMNCRNNEYRVTLDGMHSWVQEIDHVKGDTVVSKAYHIESHEWIIDGLEHGWSDEARPTFDVPLEGGNFNVTYRVSCGTCDSTIHFLLHLDPLGATRETQTYTLCDADRKGEGFHWKERSDTTYHTYGIVDSVFLYSEITSCDSIIYLELLEPTRVFEDTMLLPENLPFTYHGKIYDENTKSMIDTVPDPNDCSKTWVLNLEIYESLIVEPVTAYTLCEGADTLLFVYDIKRGRSQSFLVAFDSDKFDTLVNIEQKKGHYEIPLALDPNLEPGLYNGTLHFTDLKPEFNVTMPFTLSLLYSSELITQRWNDVLAIRNDSTIKAILGNSGYDYTFFAVQWYVDGSLIEGAHDFNYYTGEGTQLQFGKEYSALLVRPDGTQVYTCPFIPTPVPEAEYNNGMPSLVPPSASLPMRGKGTAYWYDVLGRRHLSENYNDSEITAPAAVGFYLLVLQSDNARATHHVLVR